MMKFKLPNSVASSQDLSSLLLDLHEYSRWFEHESIKKSVNASHVSETPKLSPSAVELLQTWEAKQPITEQSLDQLMNYLKEYGHSSPSVTITLAAPPLNSLKATLVSWCRENIAPNILVNFQFNANLLGGIILRYGSRVFDWSFKRQILDARNNFPEVLRRV